MYTRYSISCIGLFPRRGGFVRPNRHLCIKKNKANKGKIQRKTKSIVKNLAKLFRNTGNPA